MDWTQSLGLAAAVLVVLLGSFVLAARPRSWLHRTFFAFTLVDGVSTAAFDLRAIATSEADQTIAMYIHFSALIALIVLLVILGVTFPRALLRRPAMVPLVAGLAVLGAVTLLMHMIRPDWFWVATSDADGPRFAYPAPGRLVLAARNFAIAFIATRVTIAMAQERSPSHRRQAAYLLGGIVLGFAPVATGPFVQDLGPGYFTGDWQRDIVRTGGLAVAVALAAMWVVVLRSHGIRDPPSRFVLVTIFAVGLLSIAARAFPSAQALNGIQSLTLVVYPVLVGYAILRYGVLDIDRTLRRAAVVTLAAFGIAVVFLMVESVVEGAIQEGLSGTLGDSLVRNLLAGLAAAALAGPVIRLARRGIGKLAPELGTVGSDLRRLEIYRHALWGALGDGALEAREMRMLDRLRESLAIADEEHDRLVHEWRDQAVSAPS